VFGCKCFVLKNSNDRTGKFEEKSDEGIFLDCSTSSKFQDSVQNQMNHTQLEEFEFAPNLTKSTSPEVVHTSEDQQRIDLEDSTKLED